jgi:hypothetical protein
MIDEGRDPREVKAEKVVADAVKRDAAAVNALPVGDIWPLRVSQSAKKPSSHVTLPSFMRLHGTKPPGLR